MAALTLFRRRQHCSLYPTFDDDAGFNSIWVSSDSDEILEVARQHGAQLHHRSTLTSSDGASSMDAVREFIRDHPGIYATCRWFDVDSRFFTRR